jgi:hypothetical protein
MAEFNQNGNEKAAKELKVQDAILNFDPNFDESGDETREPIVYVLDGKEVIYGSSRTAIKPQRGGGGSD